MKIGLLLEGGAMRGIYTSAILDRFIENEIKVDGVMSVSAGALFGVNYLSKQKGRSLRYNLRFLNDDRYMGIKSLLKTGNIVNKEFAYYEVPFTIDPFDQEEYAKSGVDFFVTLTNLETGKAEYVKIKDVFEQMEEMRATSAMPLVSKIIEINGNKYLDGGVADPIPFDALEKMGFDKIICILTRPKEYRKKNSSSFIYKMAYRKFPKFIESWQKRSERYNSTLEKIDRLEEEGKIFVFRPSRKVKVSRIEKNPDKVKEMYALGIEDANNKMSKLIEYLK